MLDKEISLLVCCLVILFCLFSGCTLLSFFEKTEFSLHSAEVIDDQGFPSLSLVFNTTDSITLRLLSPQNRILFTEKIFRGYQNLSIILDDYWNSPEGGSFLLNARDMNGKKIFENEFFFSNQNLSVISVSQHWWNSDQANNLVGLSLTVHNRGDLPSYPSQIKVSIGDQEIEGKVLPYVVLPHTTQTIHSAFYMPDVSVESEIISILVKDSLGYVLGDTTQIIQVSSEISSVEYNWNHRGRSYHLSLPEVDFLYDYYKSLDRIYIEDYALYVFDVFDHDYLILCANRLFSLIKFDDEVEIINFIASFVQQLEYQADDPDDPTFEYPRYPVETVIDGQGDCEDMAILTSSFLSILGYEVSLIRVPKHMAVGVRTETPISSFEYYDDGYYFLETTRPGWRLGRIPDEYKDITNFSLFPIINRPILYHSWKNATRISTTDGVDFVKITVIVENLGRKTATNFKFESAFYNEDGFAFNTEVVLISSLDVVEKKIIQVDVDVPQAFSSTLKTMMYLDDVVVHQRESLSVFP